MMRSWIKVVMTVALLLSQAARAEDGGGRIVHLDFDPIEGAVLYQIQITDTDSHKILKMKVKEPRWSGHLQPGHYSMKSRSLDYRGVPGDWSEAAPFDVGIEKPVLVSPRPKERILAKASKTVSVDFKWMGVPGVKNYELEIKNLDGDFFKTTQFKSTDDRQTMQLPAGQFYRWRFTARGEHSLKSETSGEFEVLGQLAKPEIEKPSGDFVRELRWSKPEADGKAEIKYDVEISTFDPRLKTWSKLQLRRSYADRALTFDPQWPGGIYRLRVRAQADRWQSSPVASVRFPVRAGDRSEAAEFEANIRQSIDRSNGWFDYASFMVSQINYQSTSYDGSATQATFAGIGESTRVGAGLFRQNKKWGLLGSLTLSALRVDNGAFFTYGAGDVSGVWRASLGQRFETRIRLGLFFKQLPIAVTNPQTLTLSNYQTATVLGPQVGGEFRLSLTPKWGLQADINFEEELVKIATPNGQDVVSSLSWQAGLLGSYRFNQRFSGMAGAMERHDKINYGSTGNGTNSTTLSGTYFYVQAENNF